MAKAVGQFTIIDLNDITISSTAPAVKVKDMIWLDTSVVPNQLKKWNGSSWENIGDRNSDIVFNARNLLLQSGVAKSGTSYLLGTWTLTEDFIAGTKYTIVLEGTKSASQTFGAWMNGGSGGVGTLINIAGTNLYKLTFTAITPTSGNERKISIYNPPSSSNAWTLKWIALYKGADKIPLDWTPAPEDVDQKFTSYYTKTETTTQINAAKDSINLSVDTKIEQAETTINQRTDEVLEDYSTAEEMNSAINLKGAEIDLNVSKRIIGTYYQESAPTSPKAKEIWYKLENQQFIIGATNSFTIGNALGHIIGQHNPSKKAYRRNDANTAWDSVEDSDINNIKYDLAGINISVEGIRQRVETYDGRIGSLEVTASSILNRVIDAEGNIGSLQITSTSITSRLDNVNGSGSSIEQFANSITSRVTDAEGNIGQLELTANGFETRISSAEGNITSIKQTIDNITLAVDNSKLIFDANGLTIKNGGFKIQKGSTDVFYITSSGDIRMNGELYNVVGNYGVRMYNGRVQFSSGNTSWGNFGSVCGDIYGVYTNVWPSPNNVYAVIVEGISQSTLRNLNGNAVVSAQYDTVAIRCDTLNINGSIYTKKRFNQVTSTEYVLVAPS